ncbi:MAG: ABC transporter ATP-binding protein [Campylobacterales bacterium]
MLKIEGLTKEFGGVVAIKEVSFEVKEGEIFGLIGPNGAGKTTILNIISGALTPTAGRVLFKGEDITGYPPPKVVAVGIARTFQNIRLFKSMSVLENVLVGFHSHLDYNFWEALFRLPSFFREERKYRERGLELLEYLGIAQYAHFQADQLSYGNQRKVEIARALATGADLLLLDEPVAGMNPKESIELGDLILKLREEQEKTILFIEHDMGFVQRIGDRVLVLDYGRTIFEGTPAEMLVHPEVIKAYLGDIDVES